MSTVNFALDGKVAIITGGSRGMGREMALAFADHGADIVIAARRSNELEVTQKEIAARGQRVLAVQADMANEADIQKIYDLTLEEFGGVDILVNNAATYSFVTMEEESFEEFNRIMNVNVWSVLSLSRLCRKSMIERGGGAIINIASNEALRPSTGIGTYAPAKAAMVNMTQLMAKEWADDNICLNCIAPGLIRTDLSVDLVAEVEASGSYTNPLKRIGQPQEVAALALYLASTMGRYTTGMTYTIDGGELACGPADAIVGAAENTVNAA